MRFPLGVLAIRFQRQGCANRPFFVCVLTKKGVEMPDPYIEQIGVYDPMPNMYNEKLVSFNFDRLRYWIGYGANVTEPVAELLGLCGFLPIHPRTCMIAWRNKRKELEEKEAKARELAESSSADPTTQTKRDEIVK